MYVIHILFYKCVCLCVLHACPYAYLCVYSFLFFKLSKLVLFRELVYWWPLFGSLILDPILTLELTREVEQRYNLLWTLSILNFWQIHRERKWIRALQGLKKAGSREWQLMSICVSFCRDVNDVKSGSGHGCTTLWTYSRPLNCTSKRWFF